MPSAKIRTAVLENQEGSENIMIKSISVENFRCFKKLEASDLRRVNVLVGKNAAGKTAFIEAIKLGLEATPGVLFWLNTMVRASQTFLLPNASNDQFQAVFIDFFHDFNPEATISIRTTDFAGRVATLQVHFDPSATVTTQPAIGFKAAEFAGGVAAPLTIVPIAFERKDFQGLAAKLFATVDQSGQLQMQPGRPMGLVSALFPNTHFGNANENAAWLSKLSVEKRSDEVIEALQRHFPFIRGITSEAALGIPGSATVFADVRTLPRKIPLSLVSSGISKLFTLMLAIVTFKGGVVLIDEVENGIYHDQYPLVWKTLFDLATHHKTQLFISTHSLECLREMVPVMDANENEFRLLRLTKDNGESSAEQVKGKFLESALEQNFEVR